MSIVVILSFCIFVPSIVLSVMLSPAIAVILAPLPLKLAAIIGFVEVIVDVVYISSVLYLNLKFHPDGTPDHASILHAHTYPYPSPLYVIFIAAALSPNALSHILTAAHCEVQASPLVEESKIISGATLAELLTKLSNEMISLLPRFRLVVAV